MTAAATLVDGAVKGQALVFGSLPPRARDLDVLVLPEDQASVEAALEEAGYRKSGDSWARFALCSADVVDIVPAERWLPVENLDQLFAAAIPLPPFQHLCRPAPAHVLLLLARRLVRSGRPLTAAHRARINDALAMDPGAWSTARSEAPRWGATTALAALARAYRNGRRVPLPRRIVATAERGVAAGDDRLSAWRSAMLAQRPRRRTGHLVALSGLDGAGKSSQAEALAASLDRLGYDAVTRWTRISHNPSLKVLARPVVKALLAVRKPAEPASSPVDLDPSRLAVPSQRLRHSSRVLTEGWAGTVAVLNAATHRRAAVRDLRAGRIVVSDRWTLDSAVHLRYRYGEARRFGWQTVAIRLLSPRPMVTFFLDIPAETALARKNDHFGLAQLARQEALYQEEYRRMGAVRLDGRRPREELCADIAETVRAALAADRRRFRRRPKGQDSAR